MVNILPILPIYSQRDIDIDREKDEPVKEKTNDDTFSKKLSEDKKTEKSEEDNERETEEIKKKKKRVDNTLASLIGSQGHYQLLGEQKDIGELLSKISQESMSLSNILNNEQSMKKLLQSLQMGELSKKELQQLQLFLKDKQLSQEKLQQLLEKLSQLHNKEIQVENVQLHMDAQGNDANTSEQSFSQLLSKKENMEMNISTEQVTQSGTTNTVIYQKTTLNNLADTLQQKIEYLQKFVVKSDKAHIQLDPEHLGKVDVMMHKVGNKLLVDIDVHKELAKKSVELLFEDLRFKLAEKGVDVQLNFTERESSQENSKQQQQQKHEEANNSNEDSEIFSDILGGIEDGQYN